MSYVDKQVLSWVCTCGDVVTSYDDEQLERSVESHEYRAHGIAPSYVGPHMEGRPFTKSAS